MGDSLRREDGCSIDRLPENILIHILSFLSVREACRTSSVSRSWRNLWKSIPRLSFDDCHDIISIYHALRRHDGSSVRSFRAEIAYTGLEHLFIYLLIQSVVRHSVEYFGMKFLNSDREDYYVFPLRLFTGGSLQDLFLSDCKLDIRGALCLQSLKTLTLEQVVDLDNVMINTILSACPLLENLSVCQCSFNAQEFDIVDSRGQLKSLELVICNGPAEIRIQIDAVNLSTIVIAGDLRSMDIHLKNPSSLNNATLHFSTDFKSYGHCHAKLMKLLGYLSNAEVIRLRDWRVLHMMAYQKKEILPVACNFKTKHLGLWTSEDLWLEIRVIVRLLCRFPNLESLTVEHNQFLGHVCLQYDPNEVAYWMDRKRSFSRVLQHVKHITLIGFSPSGDIRRDYNSIRTDLEHECIDPLYVDVYVKLREELHWDFVKNLLMNANKLERMAIFLPKDRYHSEREKRSDIVATLSRTIEAFPRAASDAEILLL